MKQVLSIAGLDSLAGGGMTADLKTFEEFGVFGHALLTCVVAIKDDLMFHDLPEPVIQAQLDSLRSVVSLDAIKIGLLHQTAIIELLRDFYKHLPDRSCSIQFLPLKKEILPLTTPIKQD